MVVVFPGIVSVSHQVVIFLFQGGNSLSGGRSDIPKEFLEMFCTEQLVPGQ